MRPVFALLVAALLLPAALAPAPAAAHSAELNQIKIGHAWAPPTDGSSGPIYMPLLNDRDSDVTLTEIATPIAETVVLRTGKNENAQRIESLTLQPGQPLALAAWRVHLWMEGLRQPLQAGDRFPLTLTFEPGGQIEIEVIVESAPGH